MNFKNSAKLLKKCRADSEMTQREVGSYLGMVAGYQYVSNCERGLCSIAPEYFKKLSKLFKIDPQQFVDAYLIDVKDWLQDVIK